MQRRGQGWRSSSLSFRPYATLGTYHQFPTRINISSSNFSPATTSEVPTKESMADAYWGSLSDKYLDVNRQSRVATPSTAAPSSAGICKSPEQFSNA